MDPNPVVNALLFPLDGSRKPFPWEVWVPYKDEPEYLRDALHDNAAHILNSGFVRSFQTDGTIKETHAFIGREAHSEMVMVLDADLSLDPGPFKMFPTDLFGDENTYTHLWYVRNPINGLVYGHGGPKLFNRTALMRANRVDLVDMTTGLDAPLCIHAECVGIHAFNWSALSTWRTAFREVAKLTQAVLLGDGEEVSFAEASQRLTTWMTVADPEVPYSDICLSGAQHGNRMAKENPHDISWVNDYDYLESMFKELHPGEV